MHRYPEGTLAIPQDFRTKRFTDAIASASSGGYSSINSALSKSAATALEEDRPTEAKALWLVADATSMMLKPKSVNDPFAPMLEFEDRRTAIASDFSSEDISLFAAVAIEFEDHLVRARLCDLVWLRGIPRDVNFARIAIDAYRAVPLTSDSYVRGALVCWERAIVLCRQLGDDTHQRLMEIEAAR